MQVFIDCSLTSFCSLDFCVILYPIVVIVVVTAAVVFVDIAIQNSRHFIPLKVIEIE